MHVLEIVVPGELVGQDKAWRDKVSLLLSVLSGVFIHANAALNMFELRYVNGARDRLRQLDNPEEFARIRAEVEAERWGRRTQDAQEYGEMRYEVIRRQQHRLWSQGIQPARHASAELFLSARAFVGALDTFDRVLGALAEVPDVPAAVPASRVRLNEVFPDLRDVRNSMHHPEDRIRRIGQYGKPMPKDGALVLNGLRDTAFWCTKADGEQGYVHVTLLSLETLRELFQDLINSFEWVGPWRLEPD